MVNVGQPTFDGTYMTGGSIKIRPSIRVVLIDDSALIHHGLKAFLAKSRHIEVVGIATTSQEALTTLEAQRPDVAILEAQVGDMSGIDLCRMIRKAHPQVGVLFFTEHDDKDFLRAAIVAGAQGYLLKSASAEAVVKSIEVVATGQAIMDQQVTQQVITWVRDRGRAVRPQSRAVCSAEDLRLLSYIASGKTNREIAEELQVAPNVITSRLQKIYKRLRISRRSEAARYYVHHEQGLDQQEDFSQSFRLSEEQH